MAPAAQLWITSQKVLGEEAIKNLFNFFASQLDLYVNVNPGYTACWTGTISISQYLMSYIICVMKSEK